jgi:hypothetical protein
MAASTGGGYRLSKQERLREREVNFENSVLLSKMLDIIKVCFYIIHQYIEEKRKCESYSWTDKADPD